MQKLLKISQQTFWQAVVKLITTTSGFIILGIVSRNYGESGTGIFTLALAYLGFFFVVSDFGFNAYFLSSVKSQESRIKGEWQKLLGTRILWASFLIIISLAPLLFLPSNFSAEFKLSVLIGSLIILFFAINLTSQALFQLKFRYDFDILPTLFGVIFCIILVFLLAAGGGPVFLLILGYLVAWFIHAVGTLILVSKISKPVYPIFDLSYAKLLFKKSWPIAATLFLNVIYFRADAFILSFFKGIADVGIYNMAYQVFQAVLVLPTFIMNSFYPMLLQSLKLGNGVFLRQIKIALPLIFLISIFIMLIFYSFSYLIIPLIAGNGFVESVSALRILSFGFPAYFLSALFLWVMIAKLMYKQILIIYSIGLIFNIILNLVFIPEYSYIGASWITGISEYLILLLQVFVIWRQ